MQGRKTEHHSFFYFIDTIVPAMYRMLVDNIPMKMYTLISKITFVTTYEFASKHNWTFLKQFSTKSH